MKVTPFLKWVGGKSSIMNTILDSFPDGITEYHEPFVGGGSVVIALLQSNKLSHGAKVYCSDTNEALIYCYKNLQDNMEVLVSELRSLQEQYNSIKDLKTGVLNTDPEESGYTSSKENMYYYMRRKYNTSDKTSIQASAYFIFLNKTGFRGLFRVGPNGFNVPFGHYKKPTIVDEHNMKNLQKLISHVVFNVACYKESFQKMNHSEAWAYLDPPYAPVSKTSFVKYSVDPFHHQEFFDHIRSLSCRFVMSNSSTPIVLENFKEYVIHTLHASRRINSKNPSATQEEVIIKK